MENMLIQLSKALYQIKQENQRIQQNNLMLETKIAENEICMVDKNIYYLHLYYIRKN